MSALLTTCYWKSVKDGGGRCFSRLRVSLKFVSMRFLLWLRNLLREILKKTRSKLQVGGEGSASAVIFGLGLLALRY
jgi:hypothetical protein